jgi:hypothetical protein
MKEWRNEQKREYHKVVERLDESLEAGPNPTL